MSDYHVDKAQRNAVMSENVSQLSAAGPERTPGDTSNRHSLFISYLQESAKNVACVRISIPLSKIQFADM